MNTKSVSEVRVKDPLRKVTRKERRLLLISSAFGIVIVKSGLIPTKITTLGIEFSETNQESLLYVVSAIVIYFLIAFIIYSSSDFIAWRIDFNRTRLEAFQSKKDTQSENADYKKHIDTYNRLYRLVYFSIPISFLRAIFDFGIPILVSIYSIYILIYQSTPIVLNNIQ
ncbi:MAG: hypothetical protein GWP19_12145 [Planctomycetia bacterium]|nr:hypothetical protein [Planctomycetia bacterium]